MGREASLLMIMKRDRHERKMRIFYCSLNEANCTERAYIFLYSATPCDELVLEIPSEWITQKKNETVDVNLVRMATSLGCTLQPHWYSHV